MRTIYLSYFLMHYIDNVGSIKQGVDVILTGNNEIVVLAKTGTGRYKMSADDILLHTFKSVDLAVYGSLIEHLGSLLE